MRTKGKVLVVCVTFFFMFLLTGCGKTTVNLNKYITISAEGYDSIGTVSVDFDMEAFEQDYAGKIDLKVSNSEISAWGLFLDMSIEEIFFGACVDYKLDKESKLNEGDVVTLKWKCKDTRAEEYFGVKLAYSDITYTVEGLEPVDKMDPFEYLSVSFSGIAPNGTIELTPNYDIPEMQYIRFSADKTNGLKVGDTVKVTASITGDVDSFVERFGKVLAKEEAPYTVDSLTRYITSLSDIPDNEYARMDQQLQDAFYAHVANSWASDSVLESIDLVGNYLVTLKEGMSGTPNNYVYYVYRIDYSNDEVKDFTYYWYGYYEDVMQLADGTFSVDISSYTVSTSSSKRGRHEGDYLELENGYYVAGFPDLDSFYKAHIVSKIEKYTYEQTIR